MRRIRAVGVFSKEELEQRQREAEEQTRREAEGGGRPEGGRDETDPDDLDEHAESAETELIAADDVEDDAEAESSDIDAAVEATEALESIMLTLEGFKDRGMTKGEAQLANIALTQAYKRAGFQQVKIYSTESYTDQKRVTVTRLSMEEIEKNWEAIWAKTKEAIIRFWEQVKEWFKKVFTVLGQYKDRAEKLKVLKLEGAPKAAELDKGNLAAAIHIGGQVDVAKALTTLEGSLKAVIEDQKAVTAMAKAATTADPEGAKKAVEGTLGKLGTQVGNPKAEGFDKQFVSRSAELPGGMAIVAAWNTISDVKIGISPFKPAAGEFEAKTVKTLTGEQITSVGEKIATIIGEVKGLEAALEESDREAKTLISAIDSLARKESSPEEKEKVKTLTRLAQTVLAEPGRSYVGYATRTVKALLDLCELSAREYGQKAAEAAPKPEGEGEAPPAGNPTA